MPALTALAASGLFVLSACGFGPDGAPSSAAVAPTEAAEAAETEGSDSDQTAEAAEDEVGAAGLGPLDADQMMQALVEPGDLPETPAGHSTHTGVEYFHDEVAVEFKDYRDRFGPGDCTGVMDSINVDLVGDGADEGLMHMYRFSDGEELTGLLYVWALAYDREVDTSEVWDRIGDHCADAPLRNDTDSVDVAVFDVGSFTGVQLGIHTGSEESAEDVTTFSAAIDAGQNLIMMSSVDLDEDRFRDIVETQEQKLAALAEPPAE